MPRTSSEDCELYFPLFISASPHDSCILLKWVAPFFLENALNMFMNT
jgi:hypothetical protein